MNVCFRPSAGKGARILSSPTEEGGKSLTARDAVAEKKSLFGGEMGWGRKKKKPGLSNSKKKKRRKGPNSPWPDQESGQRKGGRAFKIREKEREGGGRGLAIKARLQRKGKKIRPVSLEKPKKTQGQYSKGGEGGGMSSLHFSVGRKTGGPSVRLVKKRVSSAGKGT